MIATLILCLFHTLRNMKQRKLKNPKINQIINNRSMIGFFPPYP